MSVERYHPALVILHWLTALLIIAMLFIGFTQLGSTPNEAAKVQILSMHMPIGISLLVLTIIRFFVRMFTPKPAHASTGNPLLDKVGVATHYLLYLVVISMALTGMGTSTLAGLPDIVFMGNGSLPEDFSVFPPALGHGFLAVSLSLLLALHIGAALFHQFVRKDGLFKRMWFGK